MTALGYSKEDLEALTAIFTATEICQQPETWLKTVHQVQKESLDLAAFLTEVMEDDFEVIMTGGGTSEFVGNSIFPYLNKLLGYRAKSYGSTDITASPEHYINPLVNTLLISYGRSGNSPESLGAIQAADAVSENVYHLAITCNENGALSQLEHPRKYALNLTPETHDQSFAMTSSYTNMYLATLCVFNLDRLDWVERVVTNLANGVTKLLNDDFVKLQDYVKAFDFNRIVYLGSNGLKGVSQESALKMLELTAGQVVTMYDTPLGFRHGPKSIVNDETLTVMYLSDDAYCRQYELDLLREMAGQRKANQILVVANTECALARELADFYYEFGLPAAENGWLGLAYITIAHVVALTKSLALGCTPDNPCPTGEVNRVVTGVTIYPYGE